MYGSEVLDQITNKSSKKPTDLEAIMFIFLKYGIDYNAFVKLPIPYILAMVKAYNYEQEHEEKAYKKSQARKR